MAGFILSNTLSENGGVTRGVCQVDENGMLEGVIETHDITKEKKVLEFRREMVDTVQSTETAMCQ